MAWFYRNISLPLLKLQTLVFAQFTQATCSLCVPRNPKILLEYGTGSTCLVGLFLQLDILALLQ